MKIFTITDRMLRNQAGRWPHLETCHRCGHRFVDGDVVVKPARGPRRRGKRYCRRCAEQVNMI